MQGDASSDFSGQAHEELLVLMFGMELDASMQKALTYDSYEAATAIRDRREKLDQAYQRVVQEKDHRMKTRGRGQPTGGGSLDTGGGGAAAAAGEDSFNLSLRAMRLRSEMDEAIKGEEYDRAAEIRDQIKDLEAAILRHTLQASEWDISTAEPRFRLGQRVWHRSKGYRGVVAGWDLQCCETDAWVEKNGAMELSGGLGQLFYILLVDIRDFGDQALRDPNLAPITYIAEEELASVPFPLDEVGDDRVPTWKDTFGEDPLQHPYLYMLYLGPDAEGNLIPTRALRNRYKIARWDVYGKEGDESS